MLLAMATSSGNGRSAFWLATGAMICAAWLLVAFAVVTGFSIGLLVLPGAVVLLAASLRTPVGRA